MSINRRSFMSVGVGSVLAGAIMPQLLSAKVGDKKKNVISIFLGGGASHAETFVGAPDAIDGYKSVNGYVKTKSGFYIGSTWDKLAKNSDYYSTVHSFSHTNASHGMAQHYCLTGYNSFQEDGVNHPSIGSVVSSSYGPNDERTGIPAYVALDNFHAIGASYLGSIYNPLIMGEDGKKNLALIVSENRFLERKFVLESLDKKFNGKYNKAIDLYKKQGYSMLMGNVKDAFDIAKETPTMHESYGKSRIGQSLLTARRLIQNGVRFVSINHGGWDMHENIKQSMERLVPEIDSSISFLLNDLNSQGMLNDTLVVISTEFGRTKMNAGSGRDHNPRVIPLILAGGKYTGGKVIGEVDKNGFEIKSNPYSPIDLLKTVMDHMDIANVQHTDQAGRPRYLLEQNAKVIT